MFQVSPALPEFRVPVEFPVPLEFRVLLVFPVPAAEELPVLSQCLCRIQKVRLRQAGISRYAIVNNNVS